MHHKTASQPKKAFDLSQKFIRNHCVGQEDTARKGKQILLKCLFNLNTALGQERFVVLYTDG